MTTEVPEQLTAQIIKRLTSSHSMNDIIMDVCLQLGVNWDEAEKVVLQVQHENKTKIVLKQSPLLILLALGLFFGGFAAVGYVGYRIYINYTFAPELFPVYLATNGQALVGSFLVGAAMIAGSIVGMQSIWEAFFEWLKG